MTQADVVIYTDGGADPNPGRGGWAAILKAGKHEKVLTGNEPTTTNNRMELQAAIAALEALKRPVIVKLNTDSEYLQKGITEYLPRWKAKGWRRKGKPIPNADLWQKLDSLCEIHEIDWNWVRGHSGNPLNERVDSLARQARLAITPSRDLDVDAPKLYLRASCKGNPGPGAWGVLLEESGETKQFSGSESRTTNNRMELRAAIEGLRRISEGSIVQVYTTSDYVYQGATKWIYGWRKRDWRKRDGRPISNLDLWQEFDDLVQNRDVIWQSAKGGAAKEIPGLEEASLLAVAAQEMESF